LSQHIIVCIKSTIIKAPKKGMRITRSFDSCELNPFDLPVLETALRIRELSGGTVTALSMGPESGAHALKEAMAMGADRAVLICDPAFAGSDTLATSTVLAAAINKLVPFELVLFGTRTADSDTGHVGPQTSILLGIPMVTSVHTLDQRDGGLLIERTVDNFRERFEIDFPAAMTIHPASVQPRDVGLCDIGVAFEEQAIEKWSLAELDLSSDSIGLDGSPTKVLSLKPVKKDRHCDFLSGKAEDQADELIKRLLESGLIG